MRGGSARVVSATVFLDRLIVSTPDRSHAPAWERASGTRRRPVPAGSPGYCRRSRLIRDVPARKYIRPTFLLENDRTELAGTNRTSDTFPPLPTDLSLLAAQAFSSNTPPPVPRRRERLREKKSFIPPVSFPDGYILPYNSVG